MITLTGGGIQNLGGVKVPNGYLVLQPTLDAVVIATPAIVLASLQQVFRFDASGNLLGACKIYSSIETTPNLVYMVTFKDQDACPINKTPLLWAFAQASGSTVDIGTIVPISNSNVSFPLPIVQNPGADQTISGGFNLNNTGPIRESDGSASVPSYSFINETGTGFARMSAGQLGLSISGVNKVLWDVTQRMGSTFPLTWSSAASPFGTSPDTGLSRLGVSSLAIGNGTQGDISGSLSATTLNTVILKQVSGNAFALEDANGVAHLFISSSVPFTNTFIQGNGSGTTFIGTGLLAVNIPDANNLIQFKGVTSGTINLVPAAIAGSTVLTMPGTTGTLTIGNPKFQQFTSNGTLTIPAGVTGAKVTVIGGGGAGGGATVTVDGGGGGSGGIGIKYLSGLIPGNTLAVTVGAGGTGVSAAQGNAGTGSSVASGTQTITTISTNGGGGGFAAAALSAGGAAATQGTGGDMNWGGGGGSNSVTGLGGTGAPSMFSGGGQASGGGTGNPANAPGAGGSGAAAGGNAAGGSGAAGIVIFEWVA